MQLTAQQEDKVREILSQWHEAGRKSFERDYPNLDYDSPHYAKSFRIGGKYVHLISGTSGAFMLEVESGIIYEIKAWGVPNKKKIAGNAWEDKFHGAQLEDCRFIRGPYDNRPHVWVPKEVQS